MPTDPLPAALREGDPNLRDGYKAYRSGYRIEDCPEDLEPRQQAEWCARWKRGEELDLQMQRIANAR